MKQFLFGCITAFFFTFSAAAQQTSTVFATKSPEKIYLGGILDKADMNADKHNMIDLIEDNIVMSFDGTAAKSTKIKAAKSAMYRSINEALASSPSSPILQSNGSFSYTIQQLRNYKNIEIHLGQAIDAKEWFGITEGKRFPKTLLALDLKRIAFTVHMDLPSEGSFVINDIEAAKYDIEDLIYVNSISFGRRVIVLVESNIEMARVNSALKNILEDRQPTDQDKQVIANCTFRVVAFGNDDVVPDINLPFSGILQYLEAEITTENYGLPISFSAAYLNNSSVFENSF